MITQLWTWPVAPLSLSLVDTFKVQERVQESSMVQFALCHSQIARTDPPRFGQPQSCHPRGVSQRRTRPQAGRPSNMAEEVIESMLEPVYASRRVMFHIDKERFPEESMAAPMAKQLVDDVLALNCSPKTNLASYVNTWMEPEANAIMVSSMNVNIADSVQYPGSAQMETRCLTMLADLWHCPKEPGHMGCATIGSSEAATMGCVAMKMRWQEWRRQQGKPTDKPNIVFGINAHVCMDKFCTLFEVEARQVPVAEGHWVVRPDKAMEMVDENTIGVVAMFSSTYNGQFEDVKALNDKLEVINKENGWQIPIHVDAAAGGFVAPFTQPDLEWDFRLKNVVSINTSGHKYGLVYPGIGWILWRSREHVPDKMIFNLAYLGTEQESLNINFSHSAAQVAAQYYQFLRLGRQGYARIMENHMEVMRYLEKGIRDTGHFTILSDGTSMPVVAFSLNKTSNGGNGACEPRKYDEYDVMERIREYRWVLPAYTMPADASHVKLLRAVVRADLTMEMVDDLVTNLTKVISWLDSHYRYDEAEVQKLKDKFQTYREHGRANAH